MERVKKFLVAGLVALGLCGAMGVVLAEPSFAEDDDDSSSCVDTNILGDGGEYCDSSGDGDGIYYILNIILTVLTYGVGIAATIGLVIVGIMYMTAGPDEGKVAKAKTRILEIVIGVVVYAVMYAALQWLLPGGIF